MRWTVHGPAPAIVSPMGQPAKGTAQWVWLAPAYSLLRLRAERGRRERRSGSKVESESAARDGGDRRHRFDLKEGHDLERLLWPGTGYGNSTGLQQNCTVDGRHVATVQPIRSAPSIVVKQGRSSVLHRPNDRATSTMPVPSTSASPTWRREEKRLHRRCDGAGRAASGRRGLFGCVQALDAGLVLLAVAPIPFIVWRRKSEPECSP
jgi:hypothetical protein